jgi:hypothetical protein
MGCGFGEVCRVVVLGKCAGLVAGEAMATPASLKIFILKNPGFGEYMLGWEKCGGA